MPARSTKKKHKHSGRSFSTLQVAEITGLNRMTITRWVDTGAVRAPMKDPITKESLWTQADIDVLVRYAQEQKRGQND
jgi:predicted DNA-binding transcriptional regulator AlpA